MQSRPNQRPKKNSSYKVSGNIGTAKAILIWFFGIRQRVTVKLPNNDESFELNVWETLGATVVVSCTALLLPIVIPLIGFLPAMIIGSFGGVLFLLLMFHFSVNVPALFIPTWGVMAFKFLQYPATMPMKIKFLALSYDTFQIVEPYMPWIAETAEYLITYEWLGDFYRWIFE